MAWRRRRFSPNSQGGRRIEIIRPLQQGANRSNWLSQRHRCTATAILAWSAAPYDAIVVTAAVTTCYRYRAVKAGSRMAIPVGDGMDAKSPADRKGQDGKLTTATLPVRRALDA
jgi:protein-L-isoaspartate O-methyltransferase